MDLGTLFDRVVSSLFGRGGAAGDDAAEKQLRADMTELIVETVDTRLRLQSNYAGKLESGVGKTIAHLRAIGRQPLEPVLLARSAWGGDPRLNAFFASADDVPALLGRSKELREFFSLPANCELDEAYALLAMSRHERTVLGHQQEGDRVLRDMPQVLVNFSGHRLIAPCAGLEVMRLEVGRRIFRRLAQLALKRIVDLDVKAADLGQRKAWLAARVRLVKLAVDGAAGLLEDTADTRSQIARLERELAETVHEYVETKASVATLDALTRQVRAVFEHPEQQVNLQQQPMRLSRMGVRVGEDFEGLVNAFELSELSIGEGAVAAIAIVRCPRSEMPAEVDLLAQAERYL